MPTRRAQSSAPIYQLKVTLRDSKPPIWRRLEVPGDASLARLHEIVQAAMGWEGGHLHQFRVGATTYGVPEPEYDFGLDMLDERRAMLSRIAPVEKSRFLYEYDFGDDWVHDILVEKIAPPAPETAYPRCIKGKRACPPEDVGGVWGYAEFLEAIKDPNHEQHDEMMEWIGDEFDAEEFDLDEVNAALQYLR